jgi:UDP-N-acetylmuramyl pentapeptide phosphotransferase/UDP-N-acetylglucosamine-1-phosphate transferase
MMVLLQRLMPFVIVFCAALALTLVLTPIVREVNRRLGMVDKPDSRRINKVPIPRGGGVALFLGLFGSFIVYVAVTGTRWFGSGVGAHPVRIGALATLMFLIGLADDKWSLPPKIKLIGQVAVAFATWAWGGLGFCTLWPSLPAAVDCVFTVFWIVGAVNAFNLIDGLDGLASGIALIAVLGMAGSLMFLGSPDQTLFHFAFAGALVGFLRYNYNPASVFLGDSGSMLIGFVVATLPLATQSPNSFLVSVGVPMLAMGVPIFDTSLAILRRSIRHLIMRREKREVAEGDSDRVMSADHDHLHHRILRSTGLNQRKTAWILYIITLVAVLFGLLGMMLKSRAAGLWLAAFAVACVIVFRDMARVELFDAGRLLASFARDKAVASRRRWAKLAVPFYVVFDVAVLVAAFFVMCYAMQFHVTKSVCRVALPVRVAISFASLVFFRTYVTVWSRAMTSNFARLLLACFFGAVVGTVGVYYAPNVIPEDVLASDLVGATLVYFLVSFLLLASARFARPLVRDVFYSLDCSRLKGRKDVSRVLVYGAGLRYRMYRRELVRTTTANDRIIVGLLDDDLLLRGQYIGGIKVCGTLMDAPEVIIALNVDAVVIACEVTDAWLKVIKETLEPTGVKVTQFTFIEKEIN